MASRLASLRRPAGAMSPAGGGLHEVMEHLHSLHGRGIYERSRKDDCLSAATVTLPPGEMSLPELVRSCK
eukprot:1957883-Amphidinium_carterae.4